jgi:uncharacterized protein with PIN domain
MKFIADVMLGRLAKRMRLAGFDVLYDRAYSDNDVIRISLEQDRVILTRDNGLAARPLAGNHLFIGSDKADEQFEQILRSFPENARPDALSRCSRCNVRLAAAVKNEVRDLVPEHVYATMDSFSVCERCGRIYWKGSHVRKMGGIVPLPLPGPNGAIRRSRRKNYR